MSDNLTITVSSFPAQYNVSIDQENPSYVLTLQEAKNGIDGTNGIDGNTPIIQDALSGLEISSDNGATFSPLVTYQSIVDAVTIDSSDITGLDKESVGLGNVDNTSDDLKPVSTAQLSALNLKANLSGGNTFTGNQTFTGSIQALSANITGNLTVDTNTLFVDSVNNRVGVGTVTPTEPLTIVGAAINGSYVLSIKNTTANGEFWRTINPAGYTVFGLGSDSAGDSYMDMSDSVGVLKNRITTGNHSYFNSSWNLGIGTTSPTAKLDVNGTLNVAGNTTLLGTTVATGKVTANGQGALSALGNNDVMTKTLVANNLQSFFYEFKRKIISSWLTGCGRAYGTAGINYAGSYVSFDATGSANSGGLTIGSYPFSLMPIFTLYNGDPRLINFSDPIKIGISWGIHNVNPSYGTSSSIARFGIGKNYTTTVGQLSSKGFGSEFRCNGTGGAVLWLFAHNGTTLTYVNSNITVNLVSGGYFTLEVYSDGLGNISLIHNGNMIATTTNGPTQASTAYNMNNCFLEQDMQGVSGNFRLACSHFGFESLY